LSAPRFSVVIPVRDGAALLGRALRGVLAQEGPPFEVVVVDDGSVEDVAAVVAEIGDQRVRLIRQAPAGVSAARNAGAAAATGEYLVFLDADDEVRPGWLAGLERLVASGCDIALCGATMVDLTTGRRRDVAPSARGAPFDHQPGPFLPGMVALRAAVFREVGGYECRLAYSENTELALRIANLVRARGWVVATTAEPLVVRYVRPGNPRYTRARYEAARFMIEHHGERLARSPRALAAQHAIWGVSAARLGKRAEARRALLTALRLVPTDPANVARLVRVLAPADPAGSLRRALRALVPPERRVKPLAGSRGRRRLQARKLLWPLVRRTVVITAPSGARLPITTDPVDEQIAQDLVGRHRWVYFPEWPGGPPPAPLILDVGAHHGLYAACALAEYPGSRVICVEPSARAAARLRETLRQNRAEGRARVVVAALADAPGRGVLHVAARSWGSSLHPEPDEEVVGTEEVALVTLADVLGGERPDIVKCNAEGAEFSLVRQFAASDLRPALMIVMVHPASGDPDELVRTVCNLGYQAVPVGTEHRPAFQFWRLPANPR
jgi:FkbM family methyltransferase